MRLPLALLLISSLFSMAYAFNGGTTPVVSVDTSGLGTSPIASFLAKSAAATNERLIRRDLLLLIKEKDIDTKVSRLPVFEQLGFQCDASVCRYQGVYRTVVRSDVWLQYSSRKFDITVHHKLTPMEIIVDSQLVIKESSSLMGKKIGEFLAKEGPFKSNDEFKKKVNEFLLHFNYTNNLSDLVAAGFVCQHTCEFSGRQNVDITGNNWSRKSEKFRYWIEVSKPSDSYVVNTNQTLLN